MFGILPVSPLKAVEGSLTTFPFLLCTVAS